MSTPSSGPRTPPLQIGDSVGGKYRVLRLLGQGGMGSVYLVTHESLGSELALKVLARGSAMHHARFGREARILASLRGEHVAKVVDFGVVEPMDAPYMVMEYLPGADLSQVLEAGAALPPREAVDHVLEACEALAEAHAEGIVHRDIKPSNLFLTTRFDGSPMVKVLDFGIAKTEASRGDDALTATTMVFGSPAYMSPEQVRSSKQVGPQTDIWSLALVLYELVSKRHPFLGDSTAGIVAAIAADPPLPLPLEIGPNLWSVLEPALRKDPRERPPSIAAFARSLAPFATERGRIVLSRIERLASRSGPGLEEQQTHAMVRGREPAIARSNDGPPASSRTTHGSSRGRLGALPLVLAGLAIVGIGAWVGMRSRGVFSSSPPPIKSEAPIASAAAVVAAAAAPSSAPAIASVAPVVSAPAPSGSAVPIAPSGKGKRPGRPTGTERPTTPTAPRQGEFN